MAFNFVPSRFYSVAVPDWLEEATLTMVTMTGVPRAWWIEQMCRDTGRVIFGNILTED